MADASTVRRRYVDPTTGEVNDDPLIRPFADFLKDLAGGKTHDELSEALWDLRQRVQDTGKPGSLTLVITVGPLKHDPDTLVAEDDIKLKLPQFPRPSSVFFSDRQGNLTRNNPDQPDLLSALATFERTPRND